MPTTTTPTALEMKSDKNAIIHPHNADLLRLGQRQSTLDCRYLTLLWDNLKK
jgi:hypothetical protein